MKLRALVPLGLLLLVSAALAAPAPKPWKPGQPLSPAPAPPATPEPNTGPGYYKGKRVPIYGGTPDTGQFLPDSAVLGRVENRVLRVFDFRDGYFASLVEFRPKSDSLGRAEWLNSMVNKEVLALTALEVNKPLEVADRAVMREHTQRVLSNVAYQRMVADSAIPTEAQLRRAYEQRGWQLHLQHLVTENLATAEKAHAELVGGRIAWPAAVRKYSIDKKSPSGDLGWKIYTQLDPWMASQVFATVPGQYTRPIQDAEGFHVIRNVERKSIKIPAFESVQISLREQVQPLMIGERVEKVRVLVRNRIGVQYDTTAIAWASAHFGETAGLQRAEDGTTMIDVHPTLPEFSDSDTARVLVRWNGGRLTLGQFLHAYTETPPAQRKNVNDGGAMTAAIDGMVLEAGMAELAKERGLDRDPLAVAMTEKRREQILVEHLFQDSVETRVWVSPEDRRKYYQAHLKEFYTYRKVTFVAFYRETRAGADSLAARLRAGTRATEVLREDSLAGHQRGAIQERREDERGSPFYKVLFEELKPGQVSVSGPDKVGDYLVIQSLEYDAGRQLPYEEAQSIIDESLQNIKAEQFLNAFIDRRRGRYRIETHPELVMRIRLTDPAAD